MKITFKLFATLTDYLPTTDKYTNLVELDLPTGTTIGQVITQHRLPEKWVHLVLVNGSYVAPEQRLAHVLQEGDTLAIWPPIAGG
ncbi:MoaD/ThiS family protein [Rhodoferax sp.]|uniref:MoaD/ThiS family protein n=1 Tax=Rhodoferax sp. TaxID=50421 RepID=UPI0028448773|nr:MoaD/ThiS family protein [Rhodoferax sp.]MDR3370674.1 MoaD/ThiS family protein [Rhodoferax sp.]